MINRIIEKTEDGSDTLFVPEIDEHYHSVKGALTETQHIFIKSGFLAAQKDKLKVLEIGFGTGLNTIQTLSTSISKNIETDYHSVELYPLTWNQVANLNYTKTPYFKEIHQAEWGKTTSITDNFTLTKYHLDFTKAQGSSIFDPGFDVIYYDAFAPEKQPNMWSQQLFDYLYGLLNTEGILTTYCAKGVIRRILQTSGFSVERLPGPPGGKREILRATKF